MSVAIGLSDTDAPDTRSEYEKGLDLPLCGRCGSVAARCPCPWAWVLPVEWGPCSLVPSERAERRERERREESRARSLVEAGRMSEGMLAELGFEAERPAVQIAAQPALFALTPALTATREPLVYVVLDTETTGRGATHQPIEIAAKCTDENGAALVPAKCFYARLRLFPGVRLDPTALAVHGLDCESEAWARSALDPTEALKRLAAWWPANALLVAHNATFDVSMLERAFERAGLPCPPWAPAGEKPLCTMQLARRNGFKPSGLEALCDRFGVSNEGAHGARADVNRLIAVWPHIQKRAA